SPPVPPVPSTQDDRQPLTPQGDRMMNQGNFSRRGFLAQSVGSLVALGLPMWYAKEIVADAQEKGTQKAGGANDRIVMAAIGTGTNRTRRTGNQQLHGERGVQIMNDAMGQAGVQMIA